MVVDLWSITYYLSIWLRYRWTIDDRWSAFAVSLASSLVPPAISNAICNSIISCGFEETGLKCLMPHAMRSMWSTDFTLVFHSVLYAGSSAGFHPTVSVNMKGTALVDGCLDKLSHDSGRIKISPEWHMEKCPLWVQWTGGYRSCWEY